MYSRASLRLAALTAVILLALPYAPAAAESAGKFGRPAVISFANNKNKAKIRDLVINCTELPKNLFTTFWVPENVAVFDFPARNGRRQVKAADVKKLVFRSHFTSVPGQKFPNIPVYDVVVTLRSGEKIRTMMQVGNLSGNYSGAAPKVGTVKRDGAGKYYWAVEYDYARPPSKLVLKDITYESLPTDVDPDAKK